MSETTATTAAVATVDRAGWRGVLARLRRDPRAQVSAGFLLVITIIAVIAPLLPIDPNEQRLERILDGPSWSHPLGTDDLGRDVVTRLIFGARISLRAAVIAVGSGLLFGAPLGVLAGWRRGWVDSLVNRYADALLSFPGLVLAIAITGVVGPSVNIAMLAVGVIFSPVFIRLARAQVLANRSRLYVDAARVMGIPGHRLLMRHVVPNSLQPIIVQASLFLAAALIAEASLSFIGLGAQPPDASWGSMLGRAYRRSQDAPVQVLSPGISIMLTAWSFNTLGDAIRRAFDPR